MPLGTPQTPDHYGCIDECGCVLLQVPLPAGDWNLESCEYELTSILYDHRGGKTGSAPDRPPRTRRAPQAAMRAIPEVAIEIGPILNPKQNKTPQSLQRMGT